MTKRKIANIIPLHKDKFYVYALFKPQDFNPFYVGKGIGERVNDHFKPSNLKKNTPKTSIIKKYGDKIRREILIYFDNEDDAYSFEEYLISLYGLLSEGGCLVNYAKTRFEYSEEFVTNFSSTGHLSRKRKYSKEQILSVLSRFYLDKQTTTEILEEFGIEKSYLGYVLRGVKCKADFQNFLNINGMSSEECSRIRKNSKTFNNIEGRKKIQKVSDDEIVYEFNLFMLGVQTIEDIASKYKLSIKYFDSIFRGAERIKIPIDHAKYKEKVNSRQKFTGAVKVQVEEMILAGMSCSEVMIETGVSKTSFHRIKKKISTLN